MNQYLELHYGGSSTNKVDYEQCLMTNYSGISWLWIKTAMRRAVASFAYNFLFRIVT